MINGMLRKLKALVRRGYNAEMYWSERHRQFGFSLKGVGNKALTEEKNRKQYKEAENVFKGIVDAAKVNVNNASVLDIGCGSGFYARVLREMGCRNYTGMDVTDVLFSELRKTYPNFTFVKNDITESSPGRTFDLVVMIDVTQHITHDRKFLQAMNNVKGSLGDGGHCIITTWNNARIVNAGYEKSRLLSMYRECFAGYRISELMPFRDKFIFTISAAS